MWVWCMECVYSADQLYMTQSLHPTCIHLHTPPTQPPFTTRRCRTLYEKFLLFNPSNCTAWCKFAELEASLNEAERSRALYELAIQQPVLDMPELLWKAYIDFEIAQGERERARALYERLLERTKHVKVWMSFAKFEATPLEELVAEQGGEDGGGGAPGYAWVWVGEGGWVRGTTFLCVGVGEGYNICVCI